MEQGMDVVTLSRLLGHANPSITMDKYGHALDEHKRSSIGKLGGIYAGAKKTPSAKKEKNAEAVCSGVERIDINGSEENPK